MQKLIIAAIIAVSGSFAQAVEIKPYDPKPQTFEVDGKEASPSEATLAYLNGKTVKLCKGMSGAQSAKTFRINGKEVKGSDLKSCDVMELVATKTGTRFAKKK